MGRELHRDVTVEELRHALAYDPETGVFTWKNPKSSRVRVGDAAGYYGSDGYLRIRVGYTKYVAHRLAFLYVHGRWPKQFIDHANGNRADNRIDNLREADHAENMANCGRQERGLPRGVTRRGEDFVAQCRKGRLADANVYLGRYKTVADASAAYKTASLERFGDFAAILRTEVL